jgi:hypothetical protein
MFSLRASHLSLAICALFVFSSAAPAADEKKPAKKTIGVSKKATKADSKKPAKAEAKGAAAVADEKTAALLDKSEGLMYLLEREGVRKASVTGESEIQPEGGQATKAGFKYEWDGTATPPKGKVTPAEDAKAMKGQLPQADMLDDFFFRNEPWREQWAGCRLESSEEGGKTVIRAVEGKSKQGMTEAVLNADGLVEEMKGTAPGAPPGKEAPKMNLKITWTKVGSKFAPAKMTLNSGAMTFLDVAVEYGKAGSLTVPVKFTQKSVLPPATTTTTFKDWQMETGEKKVEKAGKSGKSGKVKATKKPVKKATTE